MSLTSLLRDVHSPVRAFVDGISPWLHRPYDLNADPLGLIPLTQSETLVTALEGLDRSLAGTAFDLRTRIELGGFDAVRSAAAAGLAQLVFDSSHLENGGHRARILSEAFEVARALLNAPENDVDRDRAAILLAYCEQFAHAGAAALNGTVGESCDQAPDGQAFADNVSLSALADLRSLMHTNAGQLQAWRGAIQGGIHYDPDLRLAGSNSVNGADPDWLVDDCLIECKVYESLTVDKLRAFIRQLLGYVMLDSQDTFGIRHVAMFLPRQNVTRSWSLDALLAGDAEILLPALRAEFATSTRKSQVGVHEPIPEKRKHQLLADNRHTSPSMLDELSRSGDTSVRRLIGRNAASPQQTLRNLASDSRWEVREGVALNRATPSDVMERLRKDHSVVVRRAAAVNIGVVAHPVGPALAGSHAGGGNSGPSQRISALQPHAGVDTLRRPGLSVTGDPQISQGRDDSAFDTAWFSDFLSWTRGYPLIPVPYASKQWGWQVNRAIAEEWGDRQLPEDVLRDLIRDDRPTWLRRAVSGWIPISESGFRGRLLQDPDPDIRWTTLSRTLEHDDELLGQFLSDLAESRVARVQFRTTGFATRYEWRRTAAEYDRETLCLVAAHPCTPAPVLQALASSTHPEVMAALVENEAFRGESCSALLETMRSSRSAMVRELLASLRGLPAGVLIGLASDRQARVRETVAGNEEAPCDALLLLAEDRDVGVRIAVLENAATPGDIAGRVLESLLSAAIDQDLVMVLDLARQPTAPSLPSGTIALALDRLSKSRMRDPDARLIVAQDDRSSAETLTRLSKSADPAVRAQVAANVTTPPPALDVLATDPEPEVRMNVASHAFTSKNTWTMLAHDASPVVRSRVAARDDLTDDVLAELSSDSDTDVRAAALSESENGRSEPEEDEPESPRPHAGAQSRRAVLIEMVANRRAEVRAQVAFDPDADPDMLKMLGGERSVRVRRAVGANPNTPVEILEALANDDDEEVRHTVAFNGASPTYLLAELAGRSVDLAILVAMNPDANEAILRALADDGDPTVRFVARTINDARALRASARPDPALEARE